MIGCISKPLDSVNTNASRRLSVSLLTKETEQLLSNTKTRQNNLKQLSSYLSELESQLSLMFAASPDIIVFLDATAKILKISDAAFTVLGYKRKDLINKSLWDFIATSDLHKTKEYFEKLRQLKDSCEVDDKNVLINHWISKDGTLVKLMWRFTLFDERENQMIVVASDVTSFGTNEKQDLRVLQKAIDLSADGIVITDSCDRTNNIVYTNEAFCEMTGYTKQDLLGHNGRFLQSKECQEARVITTLKNSIKSGTGCDVLLQNIKKNGEIFYNGLTLSTVKEGSEVVNFIWVCKDVTSEIGIKYEWSPNAERGFYFLSE